MNCLYRSKLGNLQKRSRPRFVTLALWGAFAALTLAGSSSSGQESGFVLLDQESPVYYDFLLVAGEEAQVAGGTVVEGRVHSNGDVHLLQGSLVRGDASAFGKIHGPGSVEGGRLEGVANLFLPVIPDAGTLRALADRAFSGDTTLTDPIIDDVLFVDGTVRVRGDLNGTGTLIATGDIRLDTTAGQSSFFLDPRTRLSLIAGDDVRIGKDRPFRGVLLAGRDVIAEKNLQFAGVILAGRKAQLKKDSSYQSLALDPTPPQLALLSPDDGSYLATGQPSVSASFSDDFSGLDLGSVALRIDGIDRTAESFIDDSSLLFRPSTSFPEGLHEVEIVVRDRAANEARATLSFTVDLTAPTVLITRPEGGFVNQTTVDVVGTLSDASPIAEVTVNGQPATVSGNGFSATLSLTQGLQPVRVEAVDLAGNRGTADASILLDVEPPELSLTTPRPGQLANTPTLRFAGEARDDFSLGEVTIDGQAVAVVDGFFETDVPLPEGLSTFTVRAVDAAENASQLTVDVERLSVPSLTISSPRSSALILTAAVDVSGTVADAAAVTVNEIAATITDGRFLAQSVPLISGVNPITVLAVGPSGARAAATVTVFRDTSPPRLEIYEPAPGALVQQPTVSVRGLVNDLAVAGLRDAGPVTVIVNDAPAAVTNRGFLLDELTLAPGANEIRVVATDASGNVSEAVRSVTFEPPSRPFIQRVSGSLQSAVIGTALPQPLVVRLDDGSGQPVAGRPVFFQVTGNNGSLDGGRRQVAVMSDAGGRAQVTFTLGTRAGAGNQQVEATAAGFLGRAVFLASALPGSPTAIHVDSGDQQVGAAGAVLGMPLGAVVTDAGFNRLANVAVTFRVVQGGGSFVENGAAEITLLTGDDGRANVDLRLGPEDGVANNVVEAFVADSPAGPFASFVATGRGIGGGPTTVSGVVLDNTNLPVPGATLHIAGTPLSAQSDAEGRFQIADVPAGAVLLEVDGATVTRPGVWPHLEFDLTVIPGRDNTLGMPIHLLPLDVDGLQVSETEGGILTLPEFPGFALEVAPGSATFPNGDRSGVVSVTVVHSDKVPMPPNFGQQPRFIVTIQPAGTRFDPPARLTLPNVDGLAPGETTELYSFDHDQAAFVSIGPGTVSADGTLVVSDPGVGVVEAGWHCGGNPASSGTPHDCPECHRCVNNRCEPKGDGSSCDDEDECTANDRCQGGSCTGDRRRILSVEGKADGEDSAKTVVNRDVQFTAEAEEEHCDSLTWEWDFGDGETGSGQSATHAYDEAGTFTARVTVTCNPCESAKRSDTVQVEVQKFEVKIEEPESGDMFDMQANPPEMPEIEARAVIIGIDPDPTDETDFSWTVELDLDTADCRNAGRAAGRNFAHPTITETVTGPDYMPQFQQLRTGDAKFKAEATIEGETDDDEVMDVEVRGTNPPRAAIRNRLPHDTLGRVACHESGFRQFDAAAGGGMSKCPLFSGDRLGGVGIMQITNPAPTIDEHFDWRANVDRGIAIFNQKVAAARRYPGQVRNRQEFRDLVTAFNMGRMAAGLPAVQVNVPEFTTGDFNNNLRQLELDTIRGYNGYAGPRDLGLVLHEHRVQRDAMGQLVVVVNEAAGTGTVQFEQVPTADRNIAGRPYPGDINYVANIQAEDPNCP